MEYGFSSAIKNRQMADEINKEREKLKDISYPQYQERVLNFILRCVSKYGVTNPYLDSVWYDKLQENRQDLKHLWSRFERLDMSKKSEEEEKIGLKIYETK